LAGPQGKQVIVIGGGVVGVTTLYEPAADGVPAILLEAETRLAAGASHANGGALTPGLADPWNSPGVHKHLFAIVVIFAIPIQSGARATALQPSIAAAARIIVANSRR